MAVFNSLTIGGINSLDYGIYITGEGVYDAPNRAVEMVEIHGRNGALILDKGHFENVEIKYPCGSFGVDNKTFEQRITEFKNAVLSLRGYQRLTDTYAADVYRMASCANGFEVAPVQGGKAGEFDLVFNCKPQRFLTSGESLVTVANNGTVTNPTAFDSQPTIQVNGYGTLTFNNYSITLNNETFGTIDMSNRIRTGSNYAEVDYSGLIGSFSTGDTITASGYGLQFMLRASGTRVITGVTITQTSGSQTIPFTYTATEASNNYYSVNILFTDQTYQVGTAKTSSGTLQMAMTYTESGTSHTSTLSIPYTVTHSTTGLWSADMAFSWTTPFTITSKSVTLNSFIGTSTKSILGTPTVIDCELGEAYKVVNNQFISLNAYIDLGSDLPVLAPGTNTFTKSNTITSLKVKPNWWKL